MHALQSWFELLFAQFPYVGGAYGGAMLVFGAVVTMIAAALIVVVAGLLVLLLGPFAAFTGVVDIRKGWPRVTIAAALVVGFAATLGAVLVSLWLTLAHGSYLHAQSIAWWNLSGLLAGLSIILVVAEMALRRRFPVERDVDSVSIFEFLEYDEPAPSEETEAVNVTRALPAV